MGVLLTAENLVKEYASRHLRGRGVAVRALDGVSVEIQAGCADWNCWRVGFGKVDAGVFASRAVERPDSGTIRFLNRDLTRV